MPSKARFSLGAAVQWLRDGLKILSAAPAVNAMAGCSDPEQPIIMVPAFVGLGAFIGTVTRVAPFKD